MVSAGQKNSPTGADEVYPVIVYALLKGNINKLKSNLNFIKLYRHKNRLESEEEYYFTTLFSAVEFIESLNYTKLNIEEAEFLRKCEENHEKEIIRQQTLIKIPKISNSIMNLENNEENQILSILNKTSNPNVNDSIELFDLKNNVIPKNKVSATTTTSSIKRSSFHIGDGLLNINLENLLKQYYSGEFKDLSLNRIETLYSDFKTCLKIIEDYKINCCYNQNNDSTLRKTLSDNGMKETSNNVSPMKSHKSMSEANNVNLIDI